VFTRIALFSLCALPAFAADQDPVTRFDTMTVTATQTPKQAFDVPGSISTISKNEIDNRLATSIDDLVKDMPSVEQSGGPRKTAEVPNIRGLGDNRTVLKLNGARQNLMSGHNGRIFIDPEMLRQIDVVRGPQSTLHGSGALGGVMSLETLEASDYLRKGRNWGVSGKGGFQSNNHEYLGSAAGFGRYGDKADGIVKFVYRKSDDVKMAKGGHIPYSDDNIKSAYAKGNLYLGESHKISGSHIGFRDDHEILSTPNLFGTTNLPVRIQNAQLNLGGDLNIAVERDTKQCTSAANYEYDNDDNPWVNLKLKVYRNHMRLKDSAKKQGRVDKTVLWTYGVDGSNTTKIAFSDDVKNSITYGTEFYHDKQRGRRNNGGRLQFPDAFMNVQGYYIQDEIAVWDKIFVTPGIRHDHYAVRPQGNFKERNDHRTTPKVSVSAKPWKWFHIYYLYAGAFRAPSMSELYGSGVHIPPMRRGMGPNLFIPNPALKAERATNNEVGGGVAFEDVFFDKDKLRSKCSYFHTNAHDFIQVVPNFSPLVNSTFVRNIGKVRIHGFESETFYESRTVFTGLAFSIIRGKDRTNKQDLGTIPADKVTLHVGSKVPDINATFGWRFNMHSRQDKIPTTQTTRSPIKSTRGYVTHDIYANWQPKPLEGVRVDFAVDNLLNKNHRKHLSFIQEAGINVKLGITYTP
jgi:hemoglobin/transferrin/lactoferrin receptor protein